MRHIFAAELFIYFFSEQKYVIARLLWTHDQATGSLGEAETSLVHWNHFVASLSQVLGRKSVPSTVVIESMDPLNNAFAGDAFGARVAIGLQSDLLAAF